MSHFVAGNESWHKYTPVRSMLIPVTEESGVACLARKFVLHLIYHITPVIITALSSETWNRYLYLS